MNMKYLLNLLIAGLFLLSACTPNKEKLNKSIANHESTVVNDQLGLVDSIANKLVQEYMEYADLYTEDSKSPAYLYKAADLSNGLGMPLNAIKLYERVYSDFPEYEKAPLCLFISGFIYENQVRNIGKAKEKYDLFLEKFPNHQLKHDVEVTLKNLGKTPEEIIQEFENQSF
ncbi:MAG: tetratricopeptide (TPR) repeat protein [Sphingobacteriales bacterium]|jgi:tetratricopeptide (TPR) repeat protein